jgi:hypothetical protein
MATCRNSSENTRRMSVIHVFNKNSPRAPTESELDVLDVHEKLVKYVAHSSTKKIDFFKFFFTQAAQTAFDQFLVSRKFLGLNSITEKCLQDNATFGIGRNPYCGGHRTGYLSIVQLLYQRAFTGAFFVKQFTTCLEDDCKWLHWIVS